ncbi:transcriptional regulator [Kangiella profundi]|uniref:Transcriptional regulator n=1 Tax=Kangiella profundi TaxID=1561924 RepID=A0A2K9B056_9GAMM|nr:regulatory signaling modulator protein AmpE [Kangiella profundi]AUD78308.1 transcriptional regulator [Kangiella profundi]GGF06973.1 membrane protein [Kangiella profundi]
MALLSLIIALLFERYFHTGSSEEREKFSNAGWFVSYQKRLADSFGEQSWFKGWLAEAILILLPVLLIFLLFESLEDGFLSSLFSVALAVVILVHCLGPESPRKSLRGYFSDIANDDEQGAYEHAANFAGKEADDWEQTQRMVSEAIFTETQRRYAAVVIWFVLLGPAGALLYRLLDWYLANNPEGALSAPLKTVMDWVAGRISALAYLLAGDMASGVSRIKKQFFNLNVGGMELIEATGVAAIGPVLDCETEQKQKVAENLCALKLTERTGVILFAFVAVMSLLGWTFF